ncbi:MAG TPA: DUF167 domain-containing protein [Anaerolineales bacterium]|nr:DUF167 domain-containing protein [Anaerolineales bacterium]
MIARAARARLVVRVTPRARRDRIAQVLEDGTVKIQLTAAPVDGEANRKLIALLSEILHVPKSGIEIVAGAWGREKQLSVMGMDEAVLRQRILAALD